jgi:hypothetical protein
MAAGGAAGPVQWQGALWLFFNSAGVHSHIASSKPCLAADLCFSEIQEAWACDNLTWAGGAAGPALDIQHKHSLKSNNKYIP